MVRCLSGRAGHRTLSIHTALQRIDLLFRGFDAWNVRATEGAQRHHRVCVLNEPPGRTGCNVRIDNDGAGGIDPRGVAVDAAQSSQIDQHAILPHERMSVSDYRLQCGLAALRYLGD